MNRKRFLRHASLLSGSAIVWPVVNGKIFSRRKLIKPAPLKRGDTIGLIAPAGIVYEEKEYNRMTAVFRSLGLQVRFGGNVRKRYGYLAGRDEERLEDLHRFFKDPTIHGIVAVRGGWGANRILPDIDYQIIRENPKVFCGFSDITSLHVAIQNLSGLVTFHGPNGTSDWTAYSRRQFRAVTFGELELPFPVQPIDEDRVCEAEDPVTISPGRVTGRLIGGNLTLVTSLIGTSYMPSLEGAILFLEEIGEEIYRIDRMFSRLELSGVLDQIAGLVFGRCTDCDTGSRPSLTLQEVLSGYLAPKNIPSFYGAYIGHEPDNMTLPLGLDAELDADRGEIRLLEFPVAVSASG
ncbi:MAG: LD-carboxypeptidase [Balneolaceae bacterium]